VGLVDWSEHLPSEMSGGQQQRVAIARALINEPKVILADEPTGALDSQTSREVIELLHQINDAGTTVLIVTHEHEISEMTDRVIHLLDGVIGRESTNGRKRGNGKLPPPAAPAAEGDGAAPAGV
ncbi:MAG: ATP-binding cassette domain-containing protein, partial [Acidimicrobiia bacterium]|nr:ATP-binding cassette domain-containing protein [Acidimicrobiia bacterium]